MPIQFEWMDHVAIRVKDLEVAAKWYGDVLAFEVVNRWDNAWVLRRGRTRLGLYLAPGAVPVDDSDGRLTMHHFAFFVTPSQMIAAQVFLRENGIAYDGPKDSGHFWSLFVVDPDGYQVEFITDPPPSGG